MSIPSAVTPATSPVSTLATPSTIVAPKLANPSQSMPEGQRISCSDSPIHCPPQIIPLHVGLSSTDQHITTPAVSFWRSEEAQIVAAKGALGIACTWISHPFHVVATNHQLKNGEKQLFKTVPLHAQSKMTELQLATHIAKEKGALGFFKGASVRAGFGGATFLTLFSLQAGIKHGLPEDTHEKMPLLVSAGIEGALLRGPAIMYSTAALRGEQLPTYRSCLQTLHAKGGLLPTAIGRVGYFGLAKQSYDVLRDLLNSNGVTPVVANGSSAIVATVIAGKYLDAQEQFVNTLGSKPTHSNNGVPQSFQDKLVNAGKSVRKFMVKMPMAATLREGVFLIPLLLGPDQVLDQIVTPIKSVLGINSGSSRL